METVSDVKSWIFTKFYLTSHQYGTPHGGGAYVEDVNFNTNFKIPALFSNLSSRPSFWNWDNWETDECKWFWGSRKDQY